MDAVFSLIEEQSHCVLATTDASGAPWTSLMAYAANARNGEFVLVTPGGSRKAANLRAVPRAALLIDDRNRHPDGRLETARAVTLTGYARTETDPARRTALLRRFLERHPGLRDFALRPDAAVLLFRAEEAQLLTGVERVLRFRWNG